MDLGIDGQNITAVYAFSGLKAYEDSPEAVKVINFSHPMSFLTTDSSLLMVHMPHTSQNHGGILHTVAIVIRHYMKYLYCYG